MNKKKLRPVRSFFCRDFGENALWTWGRESLEIFSKTTG